MKKPIEIELLNSATEFFAELDDNIKIKFFRSFDKVKLGFRADFKKMSGSDDIWEFWADGNNKFIGCLLSGTEEESQGL